MRSRDDGKVPAQGRFDFLIEVVGVVVGEEDTVDRGHFVEVEGWVRLARTGHAGAKVNMVASVEEVGLIARLGDFPPRGICFLGKANIGHYAHALPFSGEKPLAVYRTEMYEHRHDGRSRPYEVNTGVFVSTIRRVDFDLLRFGQGFGRFPFASSIS